MPVGKDCTDSMYQYITSTIQYFQALQNQENARDPYEFVDAYLGANTAARLLQHWDDRVKEACGISWDEGVANKIMREEEDNAKPMLVGILKMLHTDLDELEAQKRKKEDDARGMIYG